MTKLHVVHKLESSRPVVGATNSGEVFRFAQRIHQSVGRHDIFMRVSASDSYQPIPDRWSGKVPVVNLTRYSLSLVEPDREIFPVDRANLEVS